MKILYFIWCLPITLALILPAGLLSVFGSDALLDSIMDAWEF